MTAHNTDPIVSRGAVAGMVAPILFTVLVVIAGFFFDGYSHLHDKISELGGVEASSPWLQSANFVVFGLLTIWFARALARHLGPPALGAALIGLFGLSSGIFNAVFPCDADCAGATPVGLLHNITGMVGFLAAITGMILLARRWRSDERWQGHVRFTRGAVALSIVGLVWFVAMEASGATQWNGIAQRTYVVALLGWILVTAFRLRRVSAESPETTPAPAKATTSA